MKEPDAIDKFLDFYEDFNLNDPKVFEAVYDKDIKFVDPFHKINGREELFSYFKKLMDNVSNCQFVITKVLRGNLNLDPMEPGVQSAVVFWDMTYTHKRLNAGNEITVNGCSLIHYNEQVVFHQDYFDSSQMLYRNIPVIGSIIRFIERKV